MSHTFTKLFRAPYAVPNGIQWTEEGLWIADQITDRLALIEADAPNEYGVTKLIRDIPTESSNTSGIAFDGRTLWVAANGGAGLWRPPRPHDAAPGQGDILQVDPTTGETLARYPLPAADAANRGGTHGIECDPFEAGVVWLTTLKEQTLTKVRVDGWQVLHTIPLPLPRAHGVVRVEDGVWVVHTADHVIVKLDVDDGREMARITVPQNEPQPHGLSKYRDGLAYCDATSGWVVAVSPA